MLAERLRALRKTYNLSQADVAERLNISREAYSMYETKRRQPNLDTLSTLADYYHVNIDYLLGRCSCSDVIAELSDSEKLLLEQFKLMDTRGQETVMALIKYETSRSLLKNKNK